MADALERAIDARLDRMQPLDVPPFEAITARRRRHHRRALTMAGAVLAGTAAVALSRPWSNSTPHDVRLTTGPTAGPTPSPSIFLAVTGQPVTFALVSADGRQITVNATGGGCTVDAHLTAEESSDEVGLKLLAQDTTGPEVACTSDMRVWQRSVRLVSPLADRPLRDLTSGKAVPHFDGRALATVTWMPDGSSAPSDRPEGYGWARVYTFPGQRTAAPVVVVQTPGDLLGGERFQAHGPLEASERRVHGHRAVLIVQRDGHGDLVQSRLGWVEGGYTYEIDSQPEWVYQRPLQPDTLQRIADGLEPVG